MSVRLGERQKTYLALFILGLLPILLLGLVAFRIGSKAVEAQVRSHNRSTAQLTKALVETEFAGRLMGLSIFSRFPVFIQAVADRDTVKVRERLRLLVEGFEDVNRVFISDTSGIAWVDFPATSGLLGRNYAHRDWYRGVSTGWRPYVSEVYRREARPQLLVVAVAYPIFLPGEQKPLGILVVQTRLDGLNRLLRQVQAGREGLVLLLDQRGTVAVHPGMDLRDTMHTRYTGVTEISGLADGGLREIEYRDPYSGKDVLAMSVACEIPGTAWRVVAQQGVSEVRGPVRMMAWQMGGAAVLLLAVMAWLLSASARNHLRVRELNRELASARDGLEARVQERTRELREKDEQLLQAQKMEAIGRLAGGIAHDFNNLLTVITGYAELLVEKSGLDQKVRTAMQIILDAGEQAGALTRQLLAFSRKQVVKAGRVDMNEAVAGMEGMLRRLIGEDIEMVVQLAPRIGPIFSDPGQIQQILMNLVVNARDAMPKGGRLTIETRQVDLPALLAGEHGESHPGPHVLLSVGDTGTGMDAATQARIFEPFFTTKPLGRGTGLGLPTVFGIVKGAEGRISIDSAPGMGTVFRIYLPVRDSSAAAPAATAAAAAPAAGHGTILVVEDEQGIRDLVRETLQSAGYEVLDSGNPEDGLRMARQHGHPIDLLLTDVVLPKMSGRELAGKMRAERAGMRVAYMSGYAGEALDWDGEPERGTFLIEKPFTPSKLLAAVRQALS